MGQVPHSAVVPPCLRRGWGGVPGIRESSEPYLHCFLPHVPPIKCSDKRQTTTRDNTIKRWQHAAGKGKGLRPRSGPCPVLTLLTCDDKAARTDGRRPTPGPGLASGCRWPGDHGAPPPPSQPHYAGTGPSRSKPRVTNSSFTQRRSHVPGRRLLATRRVGPPRETLRRRAGSREISSLRRAARCELVSCLFLEFPAS